MCAGVRGAAGGGGRGAGVRRTENYTSNMIYNFLLSVNDSELIQCGVTRQHYECAQILDTSCL